jgi:anti-anti-sigma factor
MPLRESGPVVKLTEAATPPPFAIDVVAGDPVGVTVNVTGEIDMLTATRLHAALIQVVDTRPRSVAVDMTGVPFMDAAGMTALIRAYNHARGAGVDIGLANVQPLVVKALASVDLVTHLNVMPHPGDSAGGR